MSLNDTGTPFFLSFDNDDEETQFQNFFTSSNCETLAHYGIDDDTLSQLITDEAVSCDPSYEEQQQQQPFTTTFTTLPSFSFPSPTSPPPPPIPTPKEKSDKKKKSSIFMKRPEYHGTKKSTKVVPVAEPETDPELETEQEFEPEPEHEPPTTTTTTTIQQGGKRERKKYVYNKEKQKAKTVVRGPNFPIEFSDTCASIYSPLNDQKEAKRTLFSNFSSKNNWKNLYDHFSQKTHTCSITTFDSNTDERDFEFAKKDVEWLLKRSSTNFPICPYNKISKKTITFGLSACDSPGKLLPHIFLLTAMRVDILFNNNDNKNTPFVACTPLSLLIDGPMMLPTDIDNFCLKGASSGTGGETGGVLSLLNSRIDSLATFEENKDEIFIPSVSSLLVNPAVREPVCVFSLRMWEDTFSKFDQVLNLQCPIDYEKLLNIKKKENFLKIAGETVLTPKPLIGYFLSAFNNIKNPTVRIYLREILSQDLLICTETKKIIHDHNNSHNPEKCKTFSRTKVFDCFRVFETNENDDERKSLREIIKLDLYATYIEHVIVEPEFEKFAQFLTNFIFQKFLENNLNSRPHACNYFVLFMIRLCFTRYLFDKIKNQVNYFFSDFRGKDFLHNPNAQVLYIFPQNPTDSSLQKETNAKNSEFFLNYISEYPYTPASLSENRSTFHSHQQSKKIQSIVQSEQLDPSAQPTETKKRKQREGKNKSSSSSYAFKYTETTTRIIQKNFIPSASLIPSPVPAKIPPKENNQKKQKLWTTTAPSLTGLQFDPPPTSSPAAPGPTRCLSNFITSFRSSSSSATRSLTQTPHYTPLNKPTTNTKISFTLYNPTNLK